MIKIAIPTALRKYCQEQAQVEVTAANVGEALQALVSIHPALKSHLMDAQGKLRSFVNVYLGEEDVRNLDREATSLKAGDELLIIPAIAGGVLRTAIVRGDESAQSSGLRPALAGLEG